MPQILLTELSKLSLEAGRLNIEMVLDKTFIELSVLHLNSAHFGLQNGFISVIENSDSLAQLDKNISLLIQSPVKSKNPLEINKTLDHSSPADSIAHPNFALNLLSSELRTSDLENIFATLHSHKIAIGDITTIRGNSKASTGLRISLFANNEQIALAQAAFSLLSSITALDIAITEHSHLEGDYRLVCFDMDSTLIKVEVIDELAKLAGVGEAVAEITESAMRGELDFGQSFKQRLSLLEGLSDTALKSVAEQLPMMDGVERLMKNLRQKGIKTAILSGGFSYFAEHLKSRFGFDSVHANTLDIRDGCLTGIAIDPIVDADYKANALKKIAENEGCSLEQVVAIGDGANDLKMLDTAGLGIAYKAKPLVRQSAQCSIAHGGLDTVLYLMGYSDTELDA
jgi:phosphoserine phosphatase